MKTFMTASFVCFLLLISIPISYAGWESSYQSKSYKFTYEVEGEIEVEPDTAVLPLMITVSAKSYLDALNQAKKLLDGFNQEIKVLGSDVFSATPLDFFKPHSGGRKSIDISFFSSGDDASQAILVFNVYVAFKSHHDFWVRAAFMAQANDFIASIENRYKKNDKILISPKKTYYEISEIEKYRGAIIKTVYAKAHQMAQIVAEAEGVDLRVDKVTFDQRIQKEVINFNRASLSINAKIDFTFDQASSINK